MKRPYHRSLLTIVLTLWCLISSGQKLKYDVFLMGNKIGETTVERRDSVGLRHYCLHSNTDAKLLFVEKKSAMTTDAIYGSDGKLFSAFFHNVKNDDTFLTKVLRDHENLLVDKDGVQSIVSGEVSFSSLLLFFTEPTNLQKVFSERLGKFFEMVRQTDGTYLASLDGHDAVYTYRAGKLIALELKSSLGSILMKLAQ